PFLEDGPRPLGAVRAAVRVGDAGALRRAAHTVGGAAGSLGARASHEATARLEAPARAGDLAGAAARLPALEGALSRLWPALAGLVEEAALAARPAPAPAHLTPQARPGAERPRTTIKDHTPLPW